MSRKTPETYRASGRTEGYTPAAPRWHGTGLVTGPSPNGLGWTEEHVQCEHEHTTIEGARLCGARLARVTARRQAAVLRAQFVNRPCAIEIYEDRPWHDEPARYIKRCSAHSAHAGTLYLEREKAEAQEWTCPWAEFGIERSK